MNSSKFHEYNIDKINRVHQDASPIPLSTSPIAKIRECRSDQSAVQPQETRMSSFPLSTM